MDASPICRGQNLTLETVLTFLHAMPMQAMTKAEFNAYAEARMNGWTQTHSQIARQMALYYEEGGVCYPRFGSKVSIEDVVKYANHWATRYFIPNPYTPSLKGKLPTNIYAYLKKAIREGKTSFTQTCNSLYPGTSLNNLDKVRVYLTNFTDILVEGDKMTENDSVIIDDHTEVNPQINTLTAKEYFYYFGDVVETNQSNKLQNAIETPIANYITQHDDEEWKLEQLQEKCQFMYDNGDNKPLAMHVFGLLFAKHISSSKEISSKLKTQGKEEGDNNYDKEILKGKNIGLFLRKFVQKGACPTLSPKDLELMKQYIDIFTNALKTKPFLLLAGISGTGKSQKVKELAYASCPKTDNGENMRSDATKPANYCLIEVKPNWHDSTELLGYWSNLSQKYMLTDFIRFAYKAIKHPNVPFFLCLDEMNLAPVEQYFAEYLSVLESRKVVAGQIVSEPLLTKERFSDCKIVKDNDYPYTAEDATIIEYLQSNGLRLPVNLFIIGTVNMDDTTHQFSRKVIDRAFTIEMNGGKLEDMFSEENKKKLDYRPDGQEAKLELFKSKFTKATDAIDSDKIKQFAPIIKTEVPKHLNAINKILEKTPFRVSYRVQNEMILYICNMIENSDEAIDDTSIKAIINTALLATLLEKILPRVQGDERLLKTDKGNVFTELQEYVNGMQEGETTEGDAANAEPTDTTNFKALVNDKLEEMDRRLKNSYFASFFG